MLKLRHYIDPETKELFLNMQFWEVIFMPAIILALCIAGVMNVALERFNKENKPKFDNIYGDIGRLSEDIAELKKSKNDNHRHKFISGRIIQ